MHRADEKMFIDHSGDNVTRLARPAEKFATRKSSSRHGRIEVRIRQGHMDTGAAPLDWLEQPIDSDLQLRRQTHLPYHFDEFV